MSVYLDNAASTPLHPAVCEAFARFAPTHFANPASAHGAGTEARRAVVRCEQRLLRALGIPADDARVVWTSGGTEANNLALQGCQLERANGLVTSTVEHPSIAKQQAILRERGWAWTEVPVDRAGQLEPDALREALDAGTGLISILSVHNETGVLQDLAMVAALRGEYAPRARLHLDAVQHAGKLPIPWTLGIDSFSISGHKLHAPGGTGALVVRRSHSLRPLLLGGGQQEGLRSGSVDALGCELFTLAVEQACEFRSPALLRDRLLAELSTFALPNGKQVLLNSEPTGSPYIVNFSLSGYQAAVLVRMLGVEGIMVAAGSACNAATKEPSRTLSAMGRTRDQAFGSLRISFGYQSTDADIDAFLLALRSVLANY